jgi:hypothetical protein
VFLFTFAFGLAKALCQRYSCVRELLVGLGGCGQDNVNFCLEDCSCCSPRQVRCVGSSKPIFGSEPRRLGPICEADNLGFGRYYAL